MRIVIISDGKYGDRAVVLIKEFFPETELIELPEYDASEIIDEVDLSSEAEEVINSADLLVNYHRHPDISYELAAYGKPMIQAIYNGEGFINQLQKEFGAHIIMPSSMCALKAQDYTELRQNPGGEVFYRFSQVFGSPTYKIEMQGDSDIIKNVELIRQSPCGSTRESLSFLKGKPVNEETLNAFAMNVRNECREPVSYVINRRGVAENATMTHIIPLIEALKKVRPEYFERGGRLENFLEKLSQEPSLPKI